jgi:hypothetical protein
VALIVMALSVLIVMALSVLIVMAAGKSLSSFGIR